MVEIAPCSRRWVLRVMGCSLALLGLRSTVHAQRVEGALPSIEALSGQVSDHVRFETMSWGTTRYGLLPEVRTAFLALAEDARTAGVSLRIASAFRNFERQKRIWDDKVHGRRVLLDEHGHPLSVSKLDAKQLVFAILRWTALPGASRHHWGTDLDVYDGAAIARGTSLALTVEESYSTFADLHHWLDERIAKGRSHGFYRPYDGRGRLGKEPWHLSYRPLSAPIARYLTRERLRTLIGGVHIALRDVVLECFDEIYAGYVEPYID